MTGHPVWPAAVTGHPVWPVPVTGHPVWPAAVTGHPVWSDAAAGIRTSTGGPGAGGGGGGGAVAPGSRVRSIDHRTVAAAAKPSGPAGSRWLSTGRRLRAAAALRAVRSVYPGGRRRRQLGQPPPTARERSLVPAHRGRPQSAAGRHQVRERWPRVVRGCVRHTRGERLSGRRGGRVVTGPVS